MPPPNAYVVDKVSNVNLDDQGFIESIQTEKLGVLPGDLFVDCSGFSGLLINKALNEPFDSYSDDLLCDRAVAIRVPYGEGKGKTTTLLVHDAWLGGGGGALREGGGGGGGFGSRTETDLRRHLGPDAEGAEAKHLQMRVGKTRNTWAKNCVSIGLSSGFVEPLESTGIYLIEVGLEHLLHNFPTKRCHPGVTANYNRLMQSHYDEIRNFLVMHYCLTQREDSEFWKASKFREQLPDTLAANLALWRSVWPNNKVRPGPFFPDYSYMCILAGFGVYPDCMHPLLPYRDPAESHAALDSVRQHGDLLREHLPDHETYLSRLRLNRAVRILGGIQPTASGKEIAGMS